MMFWRVSLPQEDFGCSFISVLMGLGALMVSPVLMELPVPAEFFDVVDSVHPSMKHETKSPTSTSSKAFFRMEAMVLSLWVNSPKSQEQEKGFPMESG
jgi:hypothetical protein